MIDTSTIRTLWTWLTAQLPRRDQRGQSTLEYVIIAAIISVAAVGAAVFIVSRVNDAKSGVVTH